MITTAITPLITVSFPFLKLAILESVCIGFVILYQILFKEAILRKVALIYKY